MLRAYKGGFSFTELNEMPIPQVYFYLEQLNEIINEENKAAKNG